MMRWGHEPWRRRLAGLGLGLLVLLTSSARGQDAALGVAMRTEAMLADQLVLLALESLAGQGAPREDQLLRARTLLQMSLNLRDDDAHVWRLRAELARLMDDRSAEIEAMRRYLQLSPQDDVAQLRMIRMGVAGQQTLDGQFAELQRILNSRAGERLSAALRSRLASQAAAAARELGHEQPFRHWLATAASLDPSNTQAALLTYELMLERENGNALAVGQALLNLVRAAPTDPGSRRRLAEHLASQAAYRHATMQFAATNLLAGRLLDEVFYHDWIVSLAASGQPEGAHSLLAQLEAQYTAAEQGGGLPPRLGLLHVAVERVPERSAWRLERPGSAKLAWSRLAQALPLPEDEDDEQAVAAAMAVNTATLLLLLSDDVDGAARVVDEATAHADDATATRLRGMLAWRRGELDAAQQALARIATTDPLAAYAIALCGDVNEARRQAVLQNVVRTDPLGLAGLLAAMTLQRVGDGPQPTGDGQRLAAQHDGWPTPLRAPNPRVSPWVNLRLQIEPARYPYLEPITARITIRNLTDLHLSLGDAMGSALSSQLMLLVSAQQADGSVAELPPIVIDAGQRLKLEPRQALTIEHRLDRSHLGRVLAYSATRNVTFSVTALLDPRPTHDRRLNHGPFGGLARVNRVQAWVLPITAENVQHWLEVIEQGDPVERFQHLARLAQIGPMLSDHESLRPFSRPVADLISSGFPDLDRRTQAWVTIFLDQGPRGQQFFPRAFEQASLSDDPMVRMAFLATHVTAPDSPHLTAGMRHQNATISSFARALQAGLRQATEAVAPSP